MKFSLYFILLVLLFTSCEKYIDMEIPDNGRKIVANCIYTDTGNIVVNLSMSRFILDNSEYNPLSGATVQFYENNEFKGFLNEFNTGIYISSGFNASKGFEHKLIITKGDQIITAVSHLPNSVSISFEDTSRVQREYNEYMRLRFTISDPGANDNYYMIGFTIKDQWAEEMGEKYSVYFYTDEPFIEEYGMDGYGVFSDESFSGQTKTMAFDFDLYNFPSDTNVLYFNLLSVSKDMYMYVKTVNAQQANDSPFAEPVMVYTNIDNGFGIFGGYSLFMDSVIVYGPLGDGYIIEY
jgi:hypothetical protein